MHAIGLAWPIHSIPCGEGWVLSHYEIPDSDFGKIDDHTAHEGQRAYGTGLNWGSVIRLSKAVEVGRSFFPKEWPTKFKSKLLNPKDHLSFIEEMLWLNLWRGVRNVRYEVAPFSSTGCKKQVDWRFEAGSIGSFSGQIINLEVKYRPRDWMRHVDGPEFNIVMESYFDDVPAKFPIKHPEELNLVAVSCPASIDRSLRERTELLLRKNPTIDGVIIWAQASKDSPSPFEIHSLKCKHLIETLFTGGDLEDAAHIGIVRHVWRKRDERRADRANEVPFHLHKLSAELHTQNRNE